MNEWDADKIEALTAQPYWIVDILPKQVPPDRSRQYATEEKWFLKEENLRKIRTAQAEVLIKLNCYFDLNAVGFEEETDIPITPEQLERMIAKGKGVLQIAAEPAETLITLDHGDTYFTVYSTSEELLELLRKLAEGSGLYVWQPADNQSQTEG